MYENLFNSDDLNRRFAVLNERQKTVIYSVFVLGYSFTAIAENNADMFSNRQAVKNCYDIALLKMRNI